MICWYIRLLIGAGIILVCCTSFSFTQTPNINNPAVAPTTTTKTGAAGAGGGTNNATDAADADDVPSRIFYVIAAIQVFITGSLLCIIFWIFLIHLSQYENEVYKEFQKFIVVKYSNNAQVCAMLRYCQQTDRCFCDTVIDSPRYVSPQEVYDKQINSLAANVRKGFKDTLNQTVSPMCRDPIEEEDPSMEAWEEEMKEMKLPSKTLSSKDGKDLTKK